MLGQSVVAGLEDEAQICVPSRAVGAELRAGGGDGDVEALDVGQDAVAGVEPEGVGLAGFDGEVEVEHVAHGPDGIFDLDVHGDGVAVRGFEIESGEIDGDAVEAGVHVLPAVGGCRGPSSAWMCAEVGGDEDVDDGQVVRSALFRRLSCRGRWRFDAPPRRHCRHRRPSCSRSSAGKRPWMKVSECRRGTDCRARLCAVDGVGAAPRCRRARLPGWT